MIVEKNVAAPIFGTIPAGMATNETWMLRGRKAIPKTLSAGYFRPEDFVPDRFGSHGQRISNSIQR
jgi:hypothetical protein